jgi:hypothetical protein
MDNTCPICFDLLKIPVKFIAFKCPSEIGHPTCNSITRVCLLCAREYLQLNKPRNQRDFLKRCILCPTFVQLNTLNAQNSYEKDFRMMAMDTKKDYECVHVTKGCEFKGNQNELDRHLQHSCLFRKLFCDGCQQFYIANQENLHFESCIGYKSCKYCSKFFKINHFNQHLENNHSKRCCDLCDNYFDINQTDLHLQICPEKYVKCKECSLFFQNKDLVSHYNIHIQHYTDRIKNCENNIIQNIQDLSIHNILDDHTQQHNTDDVVNMII